jgi:hypothetical protein
VIAGLELTPDREATLAKYEDNLMTGRRFALVANSQRSVMGYRPMLRPEDFGAALEVLGKMAREGGPFTELASNAVRSINPYGTVHDLIAKVAESFDQTMRTRYDDVAARTGPEPVRHSAAQREWTLRWRLIADCYLVRLGDLDNSHVGGPGWALEALCERERVYAPSRLWPTRKAS